MYQCTDTLRFVKSIGVRPAVRLSAFYVTWLNVAGQLRAACSFRDPARAKLLETCKVITDGWLNIADPLNAQGEDLLANEVRHFARHLPRVLTDKERVAVALVQHVTNARQMPASEITRHKGDEFTR